MITYNTAIYSGFFVYRKGVCLSSDTKPTTDASMMNGSQLEEMDTGKHYIYDAENATWIELDGLTQYATQAADSAEEAAASAAVAATHNYGISFDSTTETMTITAPAEEEEE